MSPSDAPQPPAFEPKELKAAMKAFKKRLKLMRLDDQSRIGVGPMSGGLQSNIVGITMIIMTASEFASFMRSSSLRSHTFLRAGATDG